MSFCCVPEITVYKNRLPSRSGIGYLSQRFPQKTELSTQQWSLPQGEGGECGYGSIFLFIFIINDFN